MNSKNIAAMLVVAGGLSVAATPATAGIPCGPSGFGNSNSYSTNSIDREQARAERKARKEARKAEKEARKLAKAEAKATKAARCAASPD